MLTDAERQRIYEEEAERLRVRRALGEKPTGALIPPPEKHWGALQSFGCADALIFALVLAISVSNSHNDVSTPAPPFYSATAFTPAPATPPPTLP